MFNLAEDTERENLFKDVGRTFLFFGFFFWLFINDSCTPDAKRVLGGEPVWESRVHIFPFLTGCGLKLTWPAVRSNSEGKKVNASLTYCFL